MLYKNSDSGDKHAVIAPVSLPATNPVLEEESADARFLWYYSLTKIRL